MEIESGVPKSQCHLRIEVRKTAKGDYTYDTTASVTYDGDPETLEQTIITLLRDADIIARNEINQRLRIDGGGSRE